MDRYTCIARHVPIMRRHARLSLPLLFVVLAALTGCLKQPPHPDLSLGGGGSPKCPTSLKIGASDSTPVVGSDVSIGTSQSGPMYQWTGPGNYFLGYNTGQDSILISQIMINQSGWYYCVGSQTNCNNTVVDSVYIDVRLQQGTPSCTLTNDQTYNNLGVADFTGAFISYGYNLSYSAMVLTVSSGAVEYDFEFNSNLGNTEPRDGVYYTTSMEYFDSDLDADVMNVTINYFPYLFESVDGQKVYVSHVNGKLRISFCSLSCEAEGITGQFTGQVTAPQ